MEFISKSIKQWTKQKTDCFIIPILSSKRMPSFLQELDSIYQQQLSQLFSSGDLSLEEGKSYLLASPKLPAKRLLFIGVSNNLDLKGLRSFVAKAYADSNATPSKQATILASELTSKSMEGTKLLEEIACHWQTLNYRYDHTLSTKAKAANIKKLSVLHTVNAKSAKAALQQGQALGEGINFARELGNLPASICTPSFLAKQAQALAKQSAQLSYKSLSEAQMQKLGMGSLLSVTAGTEEPAKCIILEYKGLNTNAKPHVLVGKGVTFDSGGISLKPGSAMDEMKYDMCGAASVLGTMKALVNAESKVNVVGIIGAVENMPSGKATKPGDVVTSMSGQTIEVLNTDAEGRLVLCDLLTYVEKYKPKSVIDIATLTGACIVALGKHASGLFCNDATLEQKLVAAGQARLDRVWPMPLWPEYDAQLKSNFADMANIGGPQAGSVTAACFLARFTKAYKWAHIDIAGPAWVQGANKGATGRPVGLLFDYLINQA
ncbi:MAG: leucyl aminopeptidase [Pseudomonadales bacterium]|nr:leucyl aminopeptidase [Pseudomonadales bacterium]